MALRQFLFEAGPDGASLTNANSGSSTSGLNGGAATFSSDMAAHGSYGARFENIVGNSTFRRWLFDSPATTFQFSGVFSYPGVPSETFDILGFVNSAGSRRLNLQLRDDGQVRLTAAGTGFSLVSSGDPHLVAGDKVRLAVQAVGGSTANSSIEARLYKESQPLQWDDPIGSPVSVNSANLSTDQLVGCDVGVLTGGLAEVHVIGWDDLQLRDGVGGEISDYRPGQSVPVAHAGPHQLVDPGVVVALDGSASSHPEGKPLTYQWSFLWPSVGAPALSGPSSATPSFTAGSSGAVYTLRLNVSDGESSDIAAVNVAVGQAITREDSELVWTGSAWE